MANTHGAVFKGQWGFSTPYDPSDIAEESDADHSDEENGFHGALTSVERSVYALEVIAQRGDRILSLAR